MTIQFSEGEIKTLNVSLQPVPIAPATLMGQVVDANTALPIGGVLVEMRPQGLIPIIFFTTTASNGRYRIDGIPPGSYTVTFSHPNYQTVVY